MVSRFIFTSSVFMYAPWSANILMFVTVERLLRGDFLKAKLLSVSAAFLSFVALTIKELPRGESGDVYGVTIGSAVYVWIASAVVLSLSIFIYTSMISSKKKETPRLIKG